MAKRIFMVLYAQVDERTFDLNKGAFGVQAPSASGSGTVLYPDIVINPQSGITLDEIYRSHTYRTLAR